MDNQNPNGYGNQTPYGQQNQYQQPFGQPQGQYNQQYNSQYGQPQGQYNTQYNPQQPNGPYNCPPDAGSKRVLCGIMAILFGSLGIQYFIMGKVSAGLLTILLSLVTCGIWPLLMLVQGILILCMSDQDFVQKYIFTPKSFPIF